MTDTRINAAELVAVYRLIRDNPGVWDQSWYGTRTGTHARYDVAGHVAVRAGGVPVWEHGRLGDCWVASYVTTPTGRRGIDEVAVEILGIDHAQLADLLWVANGLDRIRGLIEAWTGVDPDAAARPDLGAWIAELGHQRWLW